MTKIIKATALQEAVLRYRGHVNILSAGGRGSGKTYGMVLHLMDHCSLHGAEARPIVTRESWGGLQQLSDLILELSTSVFGGAQRNKVEGLIQLNGGGVITLTQVADEKAYAKHQGKSFSGIFGDEIGQYGPDAMKFLQRLRSNLRAPEGRRVDLHFTANPHGRAHTIITKEYINRAPPWHPFQTPDASWWVWTTGTLEDNDHIDKVAYRLQVIASCGTDKNLAKAWLDGSWATLGGVMFDVWDPAIHIIEKPHNADFQFRAGGDWGAHATAVVLLGGRLKADCGPLKYGSIIILDEIDTALPDNIALGNGASPQMLAEMAKEMCARHGYRHPTCVMDDARGLQSETVISLFRENGINAHKPTKKDRVGTWALMRQLLENSKTGDGPGLFVTPQAPHLIETLPAAPRGTLRAEDIDPAFREDHWLDSCGYLLRDLHGYRATMGKYITG